jgi:hypothetical protein
MSTAMRAMSRAVRVGLMMTAVLYGRAHAQAKAPDGGFAAAARKASHGAPVLLVIVDDAVEARSADGSFKAVIAPGPVGGAVYDPELQLLWVRRVGQLEVWDLTQDKPKAIPILADAPDQGDFAIERGDHQVHPPGTCVVPGTMTVKWSKHPSVEIKGFDEMDSPPQPRLVGAAWLAKEAARPLRSVPAARAPLPAPPAKANVSIPRAVGKCTSPGDCGSGVPFGETGWTLVVASQEPGSDCQHFRCLLHDPQAKTFGKPPRPAKWKPEAQKSMLGDCGLYRFEAGGKWFAVNDQVCAVGGACSTVAKSAQAIGWLDGGRDVGTDD